MTQQHSFHRSGSATHPNQKWREYIPCMLLACTLCSLPATGYAGPTTAEKFGQDDTNTVTLNPNPVIPVFSCPWIDTGLANAGFTPANGWNFTYAGAAVSAFVQRDITITQYSAWAVNSPNVTGLDGVVRNRGVNEDAGGAVFQFRYTPQGKDPVNIHFIQAYNESLNGGPFTAHLDNLGAANPFYDTLGVSGINTLPNHGSWFQDTPYDLENEIENYHTDVQFQVFIAVDKVNAGVHNVTLYGGDWWGYQYSTIDTPEPATITLLGIGIAGIAGYAWRRKKQQATT
jgi:hypothetical protein